MNDHALPTFEDIRDAAARIAPHAVVTPVLRSDALDAALPSRNRSNLGRGLSHRVLCRDRRARSPIVLRHERTTATTRGSFPCQCGN